MTFIVAVKLVIFSFVAAVGFGIGFQIEKKYLWLAGIGAMVSRIALILLGMVIEQKFVMYLIAATLAGLYAEIVSVIIDKQATVFLYPAIVPLIPGDLLYYTFHALILKNAAEAGENGLLLIQALLGMSIGFVVVSMIMFYRRRLLFHKNQEKLMVEDMRDL